MRSPADLDRLINAHKEHFGKDPEVLLVRESYRAVYGRHFDGKIHVLCCGKGYLYRGIPLLFTSLKYVEDFLIAY